MANFFYPITTCIWLCDSFRGFDTVHKCDRQTDRRKRVESAAC